MDLSFLAVLASQAVIAMRNARLVQERERRILASFAEGGSAKSVARKLGISAQTLRNHLHNINRKLGTRTRLAAVTHAQRHGLIG